jgi:hypothetical protein
MRFHNEEQILRATQPLLRALSIAQRIKPALTRTKPHSSHGSILTEFTIAF